MTILQIAGLMFLGAWMGLFSLWVIGYCIFIAHLIRHTDEVWGR